MLRRILTRWADRQLARERDELTHALAESRATIKLRDLQLEQLGEIIARDRERVKAETAIAARTVATCEGLATIPDELANRYGAALGVSRNGHA